MSNKNEFDIIGNMFQEKLNNAETPELAEAFAKAFFEQVGFKKLSKNWEDWELVVIPSKIEQPNGKIAFRPKDVALRYKKTDEDGKENFLSFRLLGIVKVTKVA